MDDYYDMQDRMLLPGRHGNTSDYRYGFNGKEADNEIKGEGLQIDYGFRIYDPRLGRFLSQDPLFKSFPWYTPYQFAGNKPIESVDLDGLEELDYRVLQKDEEFVYLRVSVDREVHYNSNQGKLIIHNLDSNEKYDDFGYKYQELDEMFSTNSEKNPHVRPFNLINGNLNEKGKYSIVVNKADYKKYVDDGIIIGILPSPNRVTGGISLQTVDVKLKRRKSSIIIVGDIESNFISLDIKFDSNTADFKETSDYRSNIDNVIKEAGKDNIIEITTNAAYPEGTTESTKVSGDLTAGEMLDNRGEAIKKELIKKGVDENRIKLKRGNVSSGTTNTDFEFKKKK
ncbi:hypothetical protein GCM10008088_07770 [Mesonia mobilis]|uniref:RHS repeat-associated core domain-containing protein n=2 Tax=Mesonia mobilis TaxID=369791 RepID=A0ABQ3BKW0_9FLAO|nr:hypothetical protein GCM10008088_07770 [Mesonia mobilis]